MPGVGCEELAAALPLGCHEIVGFELGEQLHDTAAGDPYLSSESN